MKRGYYIMAFIRNSADLFSLKQCLESIMHFDKSYNITVVDDNSPIDFCNDTTLTKIPNLSIIKNTYYPKSGEFFPYWYNSKFLVYDVFVVMHDSMILKKTLPDDCWRRQCTMLWYFEKSQHIKHVTLWVRNICNNIKGGKFIVHNYLHNKHKWVGCFGVATVVEQTFLTSIFNKYDFENIIKQIDSRPKREACERILGIILSIEFGKDVMKKNSLNKSIFNHPDKFDYNSKNSVLTFRQLLSKYQTYDSYIIKLWKGR